MKKTILPILTLAIILATQVKAHFVRGSIYEKNRQFIVLLGDLHVKHIPQQHKDLIRQLKSFGQEETITLIENPISEKLKKISKKYALARQKIDIQPPKEGYTKEISSLIFLDENLEQENLNTMNIDFRFVTLALIQEMELLLLQPTYDPILSKEDAIFEIQKTSKMLEQYIQEVSTPTSDLYQNKDLILPVIKDILALNKKICTSLKKYEYSLAEIQKMGSDIFIEITVLSFKLTRFGINIPGILEIKAIYNILKNKNKKIIVVCAGLAHILEIENLIKKAKYRLISETGINEEFMQLLIAPMKMIVNPPSDSKLRAGIRLMCSMGINPKSIEEAQKKAFKELVVKYNPINIAKLFETIEVLISKSKMEVMLYKPSPLEILLEQKVKSMMRNSIEQIARPIDGTSQIVTKQIKDNYSLMFTEKNRPKPLLAIECKPDTES